MLIFNTTQYAAKCNGIASGHQTVAKGNNWDMTAISVALAVVGCKQIWFIDVFYPMYFLCPLLNASL